MMEKARHYTNMHTLQRRNKRMGEFGEFFVIRALFKHTGRLPGNYYFQNGKNCNNI